MSLDEVERIGAVLGSPRQGAAEDFFRAIRESGALPQGVEAEEAARSVVCILLARLDLEQGRQVLDALPSEVLERVGRCPVHGGQAGESFGATDFLRRVAEHLQLAQDLVEPMAAAVFHALRAQLPPHANDIVERQLPRELEELWRGGGRT